MTPGSWLFLGGLDAYVLLSMMQALYLIRVADRCHEVLVRPSRLVRLGAGAVLLPTREVF